MTIPLTVRLGDRTITRQVDDLSFRRGLHGPAECSFKLAAPLQTAIAAFEKVYVFDGTSADTVWEGRLEDPGRSVAGDGQQWDMSAIGETARAADQTISVVYVDRDLGTFTQTGASAPSANTSQSTVPGSADVPSGTDALLMQFNPGQPIDTGSVAAMQYLTLNQIGQDLGGLGFSHVAGGNFAVYEMQRGVYDVGSGVFTVVSQHAFSTTPADRPGASAGSSFAAGADAVVLRIRRVSGGATTVGNDTTWGAFYDVWVRGLVKDKTGADITGAGTYTSPYILAHEVVADLLGRALPTYDGANASIDTSSTYQIDQFAFPDGITAEALLEELTKFEPDFYWQVGASDPATGKPSFVYRRWPTTVRYEASLKDGLNLPGADAERFNKVVVRWKDSRGRIRTTVRTTVVPELDNAGLVRSSYLDLGDEVSSQANANKAGDAFLAEHAIPPVSGTLTVARKVYDADLGRYVQPWELEPGHLIRIRELADTPEDLAATARNGKCVFRVVGMSYTASENTASLDLDAPPRTDQNLLAAQISRRDRKR